MSFLTFNYNKNLIYAIIYWVLEMITRTLFYMKWEWFKIAKTDNINEYFYVTMENISDLSAGFLVLYIKYSLKKKKVEETKNNDNNNDNNDNISMSYKRIKIIEGVANIEPRSKSFIYKIIAICCLNYLNQSTFFIFYQIFQNANHYNISHKVQKDIIIHLDIIARYLFSIIILKTKVFKHHKLAIFTILIGFIILFPTDIIYLFNFTSEEISKLYTFIYIGIFSIRGILFPLQDTIIKKVFIDDYIIPEFLMFIRGFGQFIIMVIVTPFLFFFVWETEIILEGSLTKNILVIIYYTLIAFVKGFLLLKVIYYFSSQSVSFLIISESITGSITDIIQFFISPEDYKNWYFIILLIEAVVIFISMFGTLIYDEIIVIKKWGMDFNVAKEISDRSVLELSTIKIFEDNQEEQEQEHNDEEK